MWQKNLLLRIIFISILAMFISVSLVSAAVKVDTSELRAAVTADNIVDHLEWLETNGPRVSGTSGYDAAAGYVAGLLEDAGYNVTYQPFAYDLWEELSLPILEQVSPNPAVYEPYELDGFATMEYSGADDVTAEVVLAANLGCSADDFSGADFSGKIALIERGVCNFSVKAVNAENAGAAGAIIFNDEARQEAFLGTLGGPVVSIPVVGSSYAVGQALIGDDVMAHLFVDAVTTEGIPTTNVIAETPDGRDDRVVVVGAHLDTVAAGPGINDNGSGVATILEIAEQMAGLGIEPVNKVRFAFWGAEESGLIGSQFYVDSLSKRDIKDIALNLNFDMIASPEYELFVYDGDGSNTETAGPNGSKNIEAVFVDYFADQELDSAPTEFDGRSDYGPFIDVGIPAGGLFAGAEGYDNCYHRACDDLSNISAEALDTMSDAAAHTIMTFAMTTSAVNGTDKGKGNGQMNDAMEYKGPRKQQ